MLSELDSMNASKLKSSPCTRIYAYDSRNNVRHTMNMPSGQYIYISPNDQLLKVIAWIVAITAPVQGTLLKSKLQTDLLWLRCIHLHHLMEKKGQYVTAQTSRHETQLYWSVFCLLLSVCLYPCSMVVCDTHLACKTQERHPQDNSHRHSRAWAPMALQHKLEVLKFDAELFRHRLSREYDYKGDMPTAGDTSDL